MKHLQVFQIFEENSNIEIGNSDYVKKITDFPKDTDSPEYLYISTNFANFGAIKKQGILSPYFVKNYDELLKQANDLYWKYFEKNNRKKSLKILYLRKKIQDNNTIEFYRFNRWVNINSPWIDKGSNYKIIEKITVPEAFERVKDGRIKSKRFSTILQLEDHCVSCQMPVSYAALGRDAGGNLHWDLYSEQGVMMTIDHILPRSLGGPDHISNYQTMCRFCNFEKGNKV